MQKIKGDHRETALVIVSALMVFWFFYKENVLIVIALAIGLTGAFIPSLSRIIHFLWYKLADALGWVMSRVLLTAVFGIVLIPMAFLSRILGKRDPLKLIKTDDSMWVQRDHEFSKDDLDKPW